MDGAVTNAFPNLDFSDCSPAFKNELLFYVRKRDMIGPDFNCTAMMVPVGDAVTNDRDALMYKALNVSAPFPKKSLPASRTEDEQNIYRRMLVTRLMPFVAVFDTTDGLIRQVLYVHSCIRTGSLTTTDDLRKRCACLQVLQELEDPLAVQALLNHFGARE
jgi:hypothetical protein